MASSGHIDISLLCVIAVSAGMLCFLILLVLLRTGWAWKIATDVPNHRSLHQQPVPRVGGWGVLPPALIVMGLYGASLSWTLVATLVLALVSQVDDRRGLPAGIRFASHVVMVGLIILTSWSAGTSFFVGLFVGLLLVWLVNLYNFMDGSDGLAGGMTVIGFGTYALCAWQKAPELAVAASGVAGAAFGFLVWNFHPAKIFLGDAGSIPLGFLAGVFGYLGWQQGVWPFWLPAVTFSPFIVDASITLMRRLLRGEKFWEAHREHYYQRAVRLGCGHRKVALAYYLLMLSGSGITWVALRFPAAWQFVACIFWYGLLLLVGAWFDRHWKVSTFVQRNNAI